MALDHYALCLCGSGKKIKFCCCADIMPELEKLTRTLDGDQKVAALDQVNRAIAAKGKRPALLSVKTLLHVGANESAQAEASCDEFLKAAPGNPLALSLHSILAMAKGNVPGAVSSLQAALAADVEMLPLETYRAAGMLAQLFLRANDVIAARAHLYLQATLGGQENREAESMLFEITSSPEVPLLLKQDFRLAESPEGVAWETEFDTAMDFADNLQWQQSCERFVALAGQHPPHPAILKNIAILRSWLGDSEVATAAWHAYAELDEVPLEDAVEAEALAQLLDPETVRDRLDDVEVELEISNTERVMERLLSDRRLERSPVDPSSMVEEGQVPPKALFRLLDREVPTTHEGLTIATVPNVLGELVVFGKETDREARVIVAAMKDQSFDGTLATAKELLGEWFSGKQTENKVGEYPSVQHSITFRWRFPEGTPEDLKRSLTIEKRRELIFEKWPTLPLAVLDGKSVNEAASLPEYRVRVLAAILVMDLASESSAGEMNFNAMRQKLGLPVRETRDGTRDEVLIAPAQRLRLFRAESLDDETITVALQRAQFFGDPVAGPALAKEVLRRESLAKQRVAIVAYEVLIHNATSREAIFEHFRNARELTTNLKLSPAFLMLRELPLRIVMGHVQEVTELINTLQRKHGQEQGVAQALYDILLRFGLIDREGRPRMVPQRTAEPPAAPAGLWTPDDAAFPAAAAAAPAAEGKSKLWLPGMD